MRRVPCAQRVVEFGSSFGVASIYLAAGLLWDVLQIVPETAENDNGCSDAEGQADFATNPTKVGGDDACGRRPLRVSIASTLRARSVS